MSESITVSVPTVSVPGTFSAKAPAIITEFAFLDNSKDVLEVDTLEEQWEQAEAIYLAVRFFCR